MKAFIQFECPDDMYIDLEDYGHEPNVTWNDLTEQEQQEILDSIVEQDPYVKVCGSHTIQ